MMNGFAQFRTEIDGMPIHFIHERGKGPSPVPIILNHGWPWSFWDFHKVIGPLTDPAAYGGDPADSFDVIVPSLPGYGFSTPLCKTGINWWKTADIWVRLMDALGYRRFASQGGDWGSFVSAQLGHKYADRMIGVHLHTPAPLDMMSGGGWDPEEYEADEQHLLPEMQPSWLARPATWHCRAPSRRRPPWRSTILPPACSPGSSKSGGDGATATATSRAASPRTSSSTR
jgi:pimeloyl-ACP methyl ester carboxylesterase